MGSLTLYDHALRLFQRGSLAESQREASAGFERSRASDPVWATKFQLLEAESMLWRGLYEDALRALSSYQGPTEPDTGTVEKLAIEAVSLTREQQTLAADQRLIQAETICSNAVLPSCGNVLAARAILEAKLGQLAPARQSFLSALDFARSHHDPWMEAAMTLNLGYIALQADHYDEAVNWSIKANQQAVGYGYENLAQIAAGNLGWAFYQLGDDERALDQFVAAQKVAAHLGNFRYQLKWLSTAGYVYRDSGDWTSAVHDYRQALDLAQQIRSREDIVIALEDLADISLIAGQLDKADFYVRQVTPMETTSGAHPSAVLLLTMGKLAAARGQYTKSQQYFDSVRSDPTSLMTTRLNAGYELAELYEAQHNVAAAERMYQTTLAAYDAARSQLKSEESQLPFGTNAAQIYDSYIHFLVQRGRSEAALAAADESRARTLERALGSVDAKKQVRTSATDPRRFAQSTDSTLLFYWLGEKQSCLWVITPAKVGFFTLPSQQKIAARIENYRKALLDLRDPIREENADGQALYRMLIAPAAAMIRPNKPVVILDDGILSKLNFETLLVPGPGPIAKRGPDGTTQLHYLIDDLTLSSAPSLAMLAPAKSGAGSRQRMLLIGNSLSPDRDFPALPLFSLEMSRIESHFAPEQLSVFGGPQATPAAYIASRPEQYSYIHFVSHAVANSTDPLDSAIILSNSAGHEDSYKLYAREIIQHPIDAKLVTISACYGSGTRSYAGEGLVGLSWAFLRAGAQRVIGALWEVSDDSTPRLMDTLYQDLASGASPALALHNAKLALLHSQTRFRIPFYWAPFQIYGRQ